MTTRRTFIRHGMLPLLAGAMPAALWLDPARADAATGKDDWIAQALADRERSQRRGQLLLSRFKDPFYVVREALEWEPAHDDVKHVKPFTVPVGFVTDLASIPRAFYSVLRPDGEYIVGAILHDYLYWAQPVGRADADLVLRSSMKEYDVPAAQITALYEAVDKFGGGAWNGNRALRERGEKRVLSKLPNDSKITWADWKKEPGVFAP